MDSITKYRAKSLADIAEEFRCRANKLQDLAYSKTKLQRQVDNIRGEVWEEAAEILSNTILQN